MKYHVLPGDALAEDFKKTNIDGEIIVCRECLIEGEVKAESLEEFWQTRAAFIGKTYDADEDDYLKNVVAEFEKLQNVTDNSEINLWFEYELFCQANMWFCLSLLQNKKAKIFRVAPTVRTEKDVWKGFGRLSPEDLEKCFVERTEFSAEDVLLGAKLWKAFQEKDYEALKHLGETKSVCFPRLKEVCQAEIEKQTRPQKVLREIISRGETDFSKIFVRFGELEGVYGFGDAQLKNIYDQSRKAS